MTGVIRADQAGITLAVEALRRGDVIGLPTETVYGLAGDLSNVAALQKIFAVKGRPYDHPLIVHIAETQQLDALASEVSDACRALVEQCWPGPLTVIVRAAKSVSRIATGGRDTVAVRVPAHLVARAVITELGSPLAAPSANRFGRVSPTLAHHVTRDLGADVALVLDGGPCDIGVESTIVDCTLAQPQILRPGAITHDEVRQILATAAVTLADHVTGPSRASGMLERHYAPAACLVLHELASGVPADGFPVLDCASDPVQAAHGLYASLRAFDDADVSTVHVLLPRAEGLGYALRDRLNKAAAGH